MNTPSHADRERALIQALRTCAILYRYNDIPRMLSTMKWLLAELSKRDLILPPLK